MANHVTSSRSIEDYRAFTDKQTLSEIHRLARRLQSEHILMLNSTPAGGGVAEILNSLVLLLNNLGIKVGWRILKGPDTFFQVTKEFHNALQGADISLTPKKKRLYEHINYTNSLMTHIDEHDLIVVHDPQPLPIIQYYKKHVPWVWRFHPDLTDPNENLMNYLKGFINQYDAMVVSSPRYKRSDLDLTQIEMHPSIDPLSDKNKQLTIKESKKILRRHGLRFDKPIVAQVSRFDKWKDPIGVIKVFRKVREKIPCQLILMGNLAADDPEGPEIFNAVQREAYNDDDITILLNAKNNDLTVNALQRVAQVILQKSIKEGFALTVSEALWKGTPVVGTRAGGIPLQVIDNKNGYIVSSHNSAAEAVTKLLSYPKLNRRLGKNGHEHVRKNFLITRHVLDYLRLFDFYLGESHKFHYKKKYPY